MPELLASFEIFQVALMSVSILGSLVLSLLFKDLPVSLILVSTLDAFGLLRLVFMLDGIESYHYEYVRPIQTPIFS